MNGRKKGKTETQGKLGMSEWRKKQKGKERKKYRIAK